MSYVVGLLLALQTRDSAINHCKGLGVCFHIGVDNL